MVPVIWILAGIAALLVATNWDDVVNWIEGVFDRVKAKFKEIAAKLKNKIADIMVGFVIKIVVWIIGKKLGIKIEVPDFLLPNGQWIEAEEKSCEIDLSEVPDWAKEGIGEYETDVTDRYMEKLSLTL